MYSIYIYMYRQQSPETLSPYLSPSKERQEVLEHQGSGSVAFQLPGPGVISKGKMPAITNMGYHGDRIGMYTDICIYIYIHTIILAQVLFLPHLCLVGPVSEMAAAPKVEAIVWSSLNIHRMGLSSRNVFAKIGSRNPLLGEEQFRQAGALQGLNLVVAGNHDPSDDDAEDETVAILFGIDCHDARVDIVKLGTGKTIAKLDTAAVHATGVVKESGKKFWTWSTKEELQNTLTWSTNWCRC